MALKLAVVVSVALFSVCAQGQNQCKDWGKEGVVFLHSKSIERACCDWIKSNPQLIGHFNSCKRTEVLYNPSEEAILVIDSLRNMSEHLFVDCRLLDKQSLYLIVYEVKSNRNRRIRTVVYGLSGSYDIMSVQVSEDGMPIYRWP